MFGDVHGVIVRETGELLADTYASVGLNSSGLPNGTYVHVCTYRNHLQPNISSGTVSLPFMSVESEDFVEGLTTILAKYIVSVH